MTQVVTTNIDPNTDSCNGGDGLEVAKNIMYAAHSDPTNVRGRIGFWKLSEFWKKNTKNTATGPEITVSVVAI